MTSTGVKATMDSMERTISQILSIGISTGYNNIALLTNEKFHYYGI
jgi:hypothetical protein